MILNDAELNSRGPQIVDPFDKTVVQPASIDLRLDDTFLVPPLDVYTVIDLEDKTTIPEYLLVKADGVYLNPSGYLLHYGMFVLGSTVEKVSIPNDLVGCIEGRSSLARLGLFIHVTAGFLDPGFVGKITLEIYNVNPRPIILRPGVRICQMSLTKMTKPALRPYGSPGLGSHYQNQAATTGSKFDG